MFLFSHGGYEISVCLLHGTILLPLVNLGKTNSLRVTNTLGETTHVDCGNGNTDRYGSYPLAWLLQCSLRCLCSVWVTDLAGPQAAHFKAVDGSHG